MVRKIIIKVNEITNIQNKTKLEIVKAHKAPNTTIAELAKTEDPDDTAHNEPSHLDLQCFAL